MLVIAGRLVGDISLQKTLLVLATLKRVKLMGEGTKVSYVDKDKVTGNLESSHGKSLSLGKNH